MSVVCRRRLLFLSIFLFFRPFLSQQSPADAAALLRFKKSFSKSDTLSNWKDDGSHPCDPNNVWIGIICSNGQINSINVADMDLQGQPDFRTLESIEGLKAISLENNSLVGPMPEINHLEYLKAFYAGSNWFSGVIPSDFFQTLGSLKKLWLQRNNFSGQIPESVGELPNLKELHLEYNDFTGPIPAFSDSDILIHLDLSNNRLQGEVPKSLKKFDAKSFDNNADLCGGPLSIKCKEAPSHPLEESTDTKSSTPWIIMIVVVAMLILIVCATITPMEDDNNSPYFGKRGSNEAVVNIPPVIKKSTSSGKNPQTNINPTNTSSGASSSTATATNVNPVGNVKDNKDAQTRTAKKAVPQLPVRPAAGEEDLVVVNEERGIFGLADLMQAAAEVLGNGGLGSAYKAAMGNGVSVVVKRVREMNQMTKEVFDSEMKKLARLKHQNILTPLAYHFRKDEKLMVSEYVPKGSLLYLLHGDRGISHAELNWSNRLKIIRGVARGTGFLHSKFESYPLPHGNLKSSNVLIGSNFEPLLSDYAFHPMINETPTAQCMFAFKSPEAMLYQNVSPKSDVYCLGIIILEIITGKYPSQYFNNQKGGTDVVQWVRSALGEKRERELIDPEISVEGEAAIVQMEKLLRVGGACTASEPDERIDLTEAIRRIEKITLHVRHFPNMARCCSIDKQKTLKSPVKVSLLVKLAGTLNSGHQLAGEVDRIIADITRHATLLEMVSNSTAAREHVEEIQRTTFFIGAESDPFTVDLHQPDENLSAELQPKDVHVVKKLIQNAEDNEYPVDVDPSLEFVITSKDITNIGAPATLLVFNNDNGFSKENIESICGVGPSTRPCEKDTTITTQAYIFSNGYQIRLTERPCHQSNSTYISPEWVETNPTLSAIKTIYSSATALPTTTLAFPLKPEKVKLVKDQLSSVDPEFLLFLSKIRQLSVTEVNVDLKLNTVKPISISREDYFLTSKSTAAISYTVFITVGDIVYDYHMWQQTYDVKQKNNEVDVKTKVDEWVITLAFPNGERPQKGAIFPPGIYSPLPTQTVTNFPFILQANFLMNSSRNNILWDNKWNQGILDCIPDTFINAFTTLVRSTPRAPISSLQNMFRFLPANKSSYSKLNDVRDAIKVKLMNEPILPFDSFSQLKLKCKPIDAGRLEPAFWSILNSATSQGVDLSHISFRKPHIIASSFDNVILDFLEIRHVDYKWYADFIRRSNIVKVVSEDVYIQLLVFIAQNWGSLSIYMEDIPLIKYTGWNGEDGVRTLDSCKGKLLAMKSDSNCLPWLIKWNREFRCPEVPVPRNRKFGHYSQDPPVTNREFEFSIGRAFLPESTQKAIHSCFKSETLVDWLEKVVEVKFVGIKEYAEFLSSSIAYDRRLVVKYAAFLYTSLKDNYMSKFTVEELCSRMPIVGKQGKLNVRKCGALVPSAAHSNKRPETTFAWNRNEIIDCDGCQKPLTAPSRFMVVTERTEDGVVRVTERTETGVIQVTERSERGVILVPAHGSRWVELFHTNPWHHENYIELGEDYTNQLSYFGGVVSGKEIVTFLQSYAQVFDLPCLPPPDARIPTLSAPLTKRNAFFLLDWLLKLKTTYDILPDMFLSSIKNNSWLKVSLRGRPCYCPPANSFMLDSPVGNFLKDESLPFDFPIVDEELYGKKINEYKQELERIGVRTQDTEACEYIGKHLMLLAASSNLTNHHVLWILRFIEFLRNNHIFSGKFINIVKEVKWVRTSQGIMTPRDSVLFTQEWKAASQITNLPLTDLDYYGPEALLSFKKQLGLLGVVVVDVDKSYQLVLDNLKTRSSLTHLTLEAMLLLLRCIKNLSSSDTRVKAIENTYCLMINLDEFYGASIFPILDELEKISILDELKKIGVMSDFEEAMKEYTCTFKQHASQSSITKQHVLSFLQCYRNLKKLELNFPDEFTSYIRQEKWIMTRLGDYKSPHECILFCTDWEPVISSNSMLPFIDDSNEFYGSGIHDYREELKDLGVVTDFKDSARFKI
ncbi:hypothetical protein LXL04_030811 [Taraxacum kok-saghyz]